MSRHGKRQQLKRGRRNRRLPPPADLPLDLPTGPLLEGEAEKYLGPLGRQAKDHWRRHLPERYRQLAHFGRLHLALLHAENNHLRTIQRLMEAGHNHHEALEIVNPMFLFPPATDPEETSDPGVWVDNNFQRAPVVQRQGSNMPTPTLPEPATT